MAIVKGVLLSGSLLGLAIGVVFASSLDAEAAVTLCGRRLADARYLACYGNGFLNADKRSVISPQHYQHLGGERNREVSNDVNREGLGDAWPWMDRYRANSFALEGRIKRQNVGLVDECCLKPCTLNELLNYC